jgi:hypothetical protein
VPAKRILVLVDSSPHGDLALLVASRLTAAWSADLTVAAAIPSHASEEERLRVEGDLDVEVGVSIRATVRAIPTRSPVEALKEEAEGNDLIVTGVAALGVDSVDEAVRDLGTVAGCSLALIRAHADASLEARRKT